MKLTIVDCSSCHGIHVDIEVVSLKGKEETANGKKYDYRMTCPATGKAVFIRWSEEAK